MRKLFAVLPALVVLMLAARLCAQELQPTLEVHTATGQTTFHIGERIALKLTFTSPNDTQYKMYQDGFERVAPTSSESFDVSPAAGWVDPLATYYAYYGYDPDTGIIFAVPFLASKPVEGSLDLNQWVRFDKPGVYTVRVKSGRVRDAVYRGHERPRLQSNAIRLRIIPATPEWQSATLARGDAADLRYLATPAAIEKMTAQLREVSHGNASRMGLSGLPDSMRGLAVASMKRRLDEPDYPINAFFVDTMVVLGLSPTSDMDNLRKQERTLRANVLQMILDVAPNKELAARASTVQMLMQTQNVEAFGAKSQMAALLVDTFPAMDSAGQVAVLRAHWDVLRSPDILPELRKLATQPAKNDVYAAPTLSMALKSAALQRWYEIDPAGAKSEIFAQIGSADPALSAQGVGFLPMDSLPQFEGTWADAFLAAKDQMKQRILGSLLVRFGTGAVSSQMVRKLNETAVPCDPQIYALA